MPVQPKRTWSYSANLSFLFPEVPFLERFAAARTAGFEAVEYVCMFDHPPDELADAARSAGVETILINIPHGRWAQGERGIAIFPDRQDEFRASLADTIRYCEALGCRRVNCLAGLAPPSADRAALRSTLVANLRYASSALADAGISLVIEPINATDMPGFFLNTADDAASVLREAGSGNLAIQFDVYHEQAMTGAAIEALERHFADIGHVQIADAPGRNEPGTGNIDFANLFATLDRLGYRGHVGLEYRPKAGTVEGLSWMGTLGVA